MLVLFQGLIGVWGNSLISACHPWNSLPRTIVYSRTFSLSLARAWRLLPRLPSSSALLTSLSTQSTLFKVLSSQGNCGRMGAGPGCTRRLPCPLAPFTPELGSGDFSLLCAPLILKALPSLSNNSFGTSETLHQISKTKACWIGLFVFQRWEKSWSPERKALVTLLGWGV